MKEVEVSLEVAGPFSGRFDPEKLRRAAEATLHIQKVVAPAELSVVITDGETVRELNRSYRGQDEETDVLAFALAEDGDETFVVAPDGVLHLGEVVVSLPQAQRQSQEQGHSLEEELVLLVVHGALHLLGFDDEEPEEAGRMREEESRVLEALKEVAL